MMKNLLFLIVGIGIVLTACQNEKSSEVIEETEEITTLDSLPEGEWNGEYLKVTHESEKSTKAKRSLGSEFYNMGRVSFTIDNDTLDFKTFEKRKNVLTFTSKKINAFIQNAYEEKIQVTFHKNAIINNYKGKYKIAKSGKENETVTVKVLTEIDGEIDEYSLISGTAELIEFNPRLGKLEFKLNGKLNVNDKDSSVNGTFNLKFEEAIMTVD